MGALGDGSASGFAEDPAPLFSQVNPTESVDGVGMQGYGEGSAPVTEPGTFISAETSNLSSDALRATGSDETRNPTLAWPTDPAWAARWQAKFDRESSAVERLSCAVRILKAAAYKAHLADALRDELSAWMIRTATALGDSEALPRPALPALPPTSAPPLPPQPHKVEQGIVEVSRRCLCDYCKDFFAEVDGL